MLRLNSYRFYELSSKLQPLKVLKDDEKFADCMFDLWDARSELTDLLNDMPLRVCRASGQEIIAQISAVVPPDIKSAVARSNAQKGETLPLYSAFYIKEAVRKFETVLAAELQALDTYLVSQKGTHSTCDLIERAEIMFPEDLRADLPDKAIRDWREAGRCLVLDAPTACSFHILRAVESVMASYFEVIIGKPMPTRMRNWGVYINKLRRSPRSDIKITEFLDHIRENYRNPISHPEVFLSLDEAEVLIGVAASCIRQMVLAIKEIRKQEDNKQPRLPGTIDIPNMLSIGGSMGMGS